MSELLNPIEQMLVRKLKFPPTIRVADIFDAYDLRRASFQALVLTEIGQKWNFCDSWNLHLLTPFKKCIIPRMDETLILDYNLWIQAEQSNPYLSICDPSLLIQLQKKTFR